MAYIQLKKTLKGSILDIGGGGEGIMGRVYGRRVTAIDNCREELDDAPDNCTKLLMDAACLTFGDETFDHVTFFFSLMYMDAGTQEKALSEAVRVLKRGGTLMIWDAVIESACPEPFIVELTIDAAGETVTTAYGIIKENAAQDSKAVIAMCECCGLNLRSEESEDGLFHLVFEKHYDR